MATNHSEGVSCPDSTGVIDEASFLAGGAVAELSGKRDPERDCSSDTLVQPTNCCPDTVAVATVPPKCPAPPPKKPKTP